MEVCVLYLLMLQIFNITNSLFLSLSHKFQIYSFNFYTFYLKKFFAYNYSIFYVTVSVNLIESELLATQYITTY